MKKIKIFDTTLRDGEQSPGCSMNLSEKLEVAKALEKLGVDIIEAGFAVSSEGDFESVKAVADNIKNSVICSLSRCLESDIDASAKALKKAVSPRIHLFLATSDLHMKYKLKMTREQVLEKTAAMVKYAKNLCGEVQFSPEDATRSDPDFLIKVIETAVQSGATVINIPDTVGYCTPQEMFDFIKNIREKTRGIEKIDLAVHCHNDLGMAVANSLSAAAAGANQLECTINGIGERAGNASLEEIAMAVKTRADFFDASTNIVTQKIYKTCRLVSSITGNQIPANKAIVGANAFVHESGIHQHGVLANPQTYEIMTPESVGIIPRDMVLGKHSGRHAFEKIINDMGYTLSPEELNEAFTNFKLLVDKKKSVAPADIEVLLSKRSFDLEEKYIYDRFVINSGNTISSTAIVSLKHNGEIIEKVAIGDGPIDGAFKSINAIVEKDFVLDDYRIQAVTEGEDAQGEAVVKLRLGDNTATGRGVSTDVIEASIKAYLVGVNKLLI